MPAAPGQPRLLVYQPARLALALLVVAALLAAGGWALYRSGYQAGGAALARAEARIDEQRATLDRLRADNQALSDQVAVLQRAREVDAESRRAVAGELRRLQEELLAVREELAFYRGIVAPEDARAGLRVERLEIRPGAEPARFRYRLVLTQVRDNDQAVRGVVHLWVTGTGPDGPRTLPLAALTEPPREELAFRFRYFQNLQGTLRLPAGFTPQSVRVEMKAGNKGGDVLERTFRWPQWGPEERDDVGSQETQAGQARHLDRPAHGAAR